MTTILDVQGVSKSFGGLKAVRDVSFDLDEGEILGLIGPNGAGKTTLFNMVSGAIPADTGSIAFEGQRIEKMKSYEIARLGLVRTFQVVKPFTGLTVSENVLVGAFLTRQEPAEAEARRVPHTAGAGRGRGAGPRDDAHHRPDTVRRQPGSRPDAGHSEAH